ncbi:MAG: efflux RND transporter periplasmic adaptor subunit [Bacteroidota bacterium]
MARRKKNNRTLYWFLGIAVLGLLTIVILRSQGIIGKENKIKVQTAESEVRSIFSRVTESGTIQPTIDVPVAPDVSGEVVFLAVKEGMRVKKGDLLVTIRPDDYESILEQSQAGLAQAKAGQLQARASLAQAKASLLQDSVNFARNMQLFKDNVISRAEMENFQLQYNISQSQYNSAELEVQAAYYRVQNSQASVKQARQNLDRTNIYASMDGTITELNVEIGQRVVGTMQMAGTEILKIADLSSMEVVVEVNENDIVNVSLGDSSRIEVDAFPGQNFYGRVSEIAYSARVAEMGSTDQVTNFEVTVIISPDSYSSMIATNDVPARDESPFRPGMTSLVEIFTNYVNDAVVVPIAAVTAGRKEQNDSTRVQGEEVEPQEVVFVVEEGKVKEVPVELGISDDNFIEVKDGVQNGATIVTGPYSLLSKRLKEGDEVEESKENKKSRKQNT